MFCEKAVIVSVKCGMYSLNHETFVQEFVKINPCDNCIVCCVDDEQLESIRICDSLEKIGSWTVEELLMNENPFIQQAGLRLVKEQEEKLSVDFPESL